MSLKKFKNRLARINRDESGAVSAEYIGYAALGVVIVGLFIVFVMPYIRNLIGGIGDNFDKVTDQDNTPIGS